MLGDMPLEEDLQARKPPILLEWIYERRANCLRIAATKDGAERAGWLEDAGYFERILMLFSSREMKR